MAYSSTGFPGSSGDSVMISQLFGPKVTFPIPFDRDLVRETSNAGRFVQGPWNSHCLASHPWGPGMVIYPIGRLGGGFNFF